MKYRLFEDLKFLGEFNSVKAGADFLGIPNQYFRRDLTTPFMHRSRNKKYTMFVKNSKEGDAYFKLKCLEHFFINPATRLKAIEVIESMYKKFNNEVLD